MANELSKTQRLQKTLNRALNSGTFNQVRLLLNNMPAAEVAHIIESSPPRERDILWQLVSRQNATEVLQYLDEEVRAQFLRDMETADLVALAEELDTDDLADLLQELPDAITEQVLASLDEQNRSRLEMVLNYPEDTAGGLMNTDVITIRPDITIEVVLRYLRLHKDIPEMTDNLLVVSRQNLFVGILPLTRVIQADPGTTVREAMITDIDPIAADMPANEVAKLFERRDLISAPVVNEEGQLLGRITIDDVVDVILEAADHSLMGLARLDEYEDTFGSVFNTLRSRAFWLAINLLTAFIASSVIGMFEATIDKVVALAILMPIVASMGGIAGSQTLTLVIRAMALDRIQASNVRYLLVKELSVGALNGLMWAAVVGVAASLWFQDTQLGWIIGIAMIINLVVAGISGASLPLILRKMNIDPALAGGVILTTLTDVVGFFAFLGLATVVYGQL